MQKVPEQRLEKTTEQVSPFKRMTVSTAQGLENHRESRRERKVTKGGGDNACGVTGWEQGG